MIAVIMNFISQSGENYTLTYNEGMPDRMYLSNTKMEVITVSNEEMFQAMESLFKLRGNHESTK